MNNQPDTKTGQPNKKLINQIRVMDRKIELWIDNLINELESGKTIQQDKDVEK